MKTRAASLFAILLSLQASACATTQEKIGGGIFVVGMGASTYGIADSVDQHPRGRPDVTTRRADPNVGIPLAIAGAALVAIGGTIWLAAQHHSHARAP